MELDLLNSDARNNLAVAYELEGDMASARAQYERALALEHNHVYIRHNHELDKLNAERHATNSEWAELTNLKDSC